MTTFVFTVIGGVLIYVLGQIFIKFFIEPIHEQDKCIGEIIDAMIFYANLYSNPCPFEDSKPEAIEERQKASDFIRQLASKLRAKNQQIRWYKFFVFCRLTRKRNSVIEVHKLLIGISNSFFALSRARFSA